MAIYKIRVEQLTPRSGDEYNRYREETIYEQTVEGDNTIVEKILTTVLIYISQTGAAPIIKPINNKEKK